MRGILLALIWLTIQTTEAARERREERHLRRAEHEVRLVCYLNRPFYEIDIVIDGETVLIVERIQWHRINESFSKIEDRLDSLIEDYENFFGFFGPMQMVERSTDQ